MLTGLWGMGRENFILKAISGPVSCANAFMTSIGAVVAKA
jgi:hypothetical protein